MHSDARVVVVELSGRYSKVLYFLFFSLIARAQRVSFALAVRPCCRYCTVKPEIRTELVATVHRSARMYT